jgi:hypothetical protein
VSAERKRERGRVNRFVSLRLCSFETRDPPPQARYGEEVVAILQHKGGQRTDLCKEEHELASGFCVLFVAVDESQTAEKQPILVIILDHL